MKKLVISLIAVAMVSMMVISCGPSTKKCDNNKADSCASVKDSTIKVDTLVAPVTK